MTLHKFKDPKAGLCPIRDMLDRLGDRWSLPVIHELEVGALRFSELRNRIGDVSQRMLAQTLIRWLSRKTGEATASPLHSHAKTYFFFLAKLSAYFTSSVILALLAPVGSLAGMATLPQLPAPPLDTFITNPSIRE